jgi:hypothetical protein
MEYWLLIIEEKRLNRVANCERCGSESDKKPFVMIASTPRNF